MIPKIIHQMWVGSEIPVEYLGYTAAWKVLHPEWSFYFWDERRIDDIAPGLYNHNLWDRAEEICPKSPWQYRADVARYEILHEYGGVWVDMDFKPQKPIDPLMIDVDGWAAWEMPNRWVNNAILASKGGSKFLSDIIAGLGVRSAWPGNATVKSGPQYVTPHLLAADRFMVYPRQYFYPFLWNELEKEKDDHPNAYAVHLWGNRNRPQYKRVRRVRA